MNVAVPANVLSLCSGGGGLDLGLRLAVPDTRTVCYVENEVTACGVLVSNMEAKRLDPAPIWTDLLTFDGKPWRGVVDWVIGGYPCQPFSNAGKRLGTDDPRHLWPHVARIVSDVAPRFCFFENVGAHLRLGFREVARDLQGMGYTVAATLSTASEVGAPHGRERLFILAHSQSQLQREQDYTGRPESRSNTRGESGWEGFRVDVADTERSSGGTEPREQHQARAEVATGPGAGSLADTERRRLLEAEAGRADGAYGTPVASTSGAVGDSNLSGLEGRQRPVFSRGDELPAWPPGYTDELGWRHVLERRPDLAPALSLAEEDALGIHYGSFAAKKAQPEIRNLADGMARGLGRADQLHILGNGVIPQQAAYSLRLLMEALMTCPTCSLVEGS